MCQWKTARDVVRAILRDLPEVHVRRCFSCGNTALHDSNVAPGVLCRKCGSQDTRSRPYETAKLADIGEATIRCPRCELLLAPGEPLEPPHTCSYSGRAGLGEGKGGAPVK